MEDNYVSFKIAKLLQSKHFNGECSKCYYQYKEDDHRIVFEDKQGDSGEVDAPTFSLVLKWLREHNICIFAYPSDFPEYGAWEAQGVYIKENVCMIFSNNSHSIFGDTYEEAISNAIEECLLYERME